MSKKKYSKEQLDNIKNYGDKIKTIENPMEAIRNTPGMYIGPVGSQGFINMIREIAQNSIDQMMRVGGIASHVVISYDERINTVIIEDDGFGIPFKDIIRVFSATHTSSNFEKEPGQFSSGRHGIGAKVTNALSISFKVESFSHTGKAKMIEYSKGELLTKTPVDIPNKEKKQGTRITFTPDPVIMEDGENRLDLPYQEVILLMRRIMSLTNIGNTLVFNAIDSKGKKYSEKFVNEDGMLSSLIYIVNKPLIAPIFISDMNDVKDKRFDVIFTYDAMDYGPDHIVGFSNFCPTSKGTHMDGFVDGLGSFFRKYMNNVYLKKSKVKININDIKVGLKAFISAAHLYPNFTGQSKDELSNADMKVYVRDTTIKNMEMWAQNNPTDLQKIAKRLEEVAKERLKTESEMEKIKDKYAASGITGLPAKYVKPTKPNRKDLEFIITEGDSAHGTGKQARCHMRQGLFPIKGKLPNVFGKSKADILGNDEVKAIVNIIGGGFDKNFDINKVKFDKIIIACDADPDGSHIHVLVLSLFMLYMPDIITSGKLYKAVPPLYGVRRGKKTEYFTNRYDYTKFKQKEFSKKNEIADMKGRKLSTAEVVKLLYNNMFYNADLTSLSKSFAVDSELLEFILININEPIAKLRKMLKAKYRFMKVTEKDGNRIFDGLAFSKTQTLVFNSRFIESAKLVLENIAKNDSLIYRVNGEPKTIYEIINMFEDSGKGSAVTVFKGLGEMNAKQLAETTLHPDSDRTLIQYTLEDAKLELEEMRSIESDKAGLVNSFKLSREDLF